MKKDYTKNIEKILKRKDNKNRPQAQKVQTDKDGKHFIIDGVMIVKFKEDVKELLNYEILDYENSFQVGELFEHFNTITFNDLEEKDKFLLQNIKSYHTFYRTCIKNNFDYEQYEYVNILKNLYDANYIKELVDFVGVKNLDNAKILYKGAIPSNPSAKENIFGIETDDLICLLMPIRLSINERYERIEQNTDLFKTYIDNK